MNTLAILVHADPSVRPAYQAALPEGTDFLILNAPGGGRSSAYTQLARDIGRSGAGTLLERIVRRAGGLGLDRYPGGVVVATFSAGYGLARELLVDGPSAAQLAGLVAIDSWHAGFDPDHTAADAQLEGLIRYASRARTGPTVCWLGHSDVRTPQEGAQAFASTTQVVDELQRLMGLPGDPVDWADGGLRLRGWDIRQNDGQEHGAALTVWGPAWLGDAVRALHDRRPADTIPSPAPTWDAGLDLRSMTIGERWCQWAGFQFGLDPREIPGAEHEPIILSYSDHCRRGGQFLGVREDGMPRWLGGTPLRLPTDEMAWCAALQSAGLAAVLLPGEAPPHGLRVSAREHVDDARVEKTLRPKDWTPTPGAMAVLARWVMRNGKMVLADPLKGDNGHVRGALQWDAERYLGLGGNESNALGLGWHSRTDPLLRAWIER